MTSLTFATAFYLMHSNQLFWLITATRPKPSSLWKQKKLKKKNVKSFLSLAKLWFDVCGYAHAPMEKAVSWQMQHHLSRHSNWRALSLSLRLSPSLSLCVAVKGDGGMTLNIYGVKCWRPVNAFSLRPDWWMWRQTVGQPDSRTGCWKKRLNSQRPG